MLKILENIEKYILYIVVGVFAVFLLPNFSSPFVIPKEILLVIAGSIALTLWLVRAIMRGSIEFSFGKFDFAVILVALAYLASAIFKTPNKAEAFFFPGVATFVLAGTIIYFLINQLDKRAKGGVRTALFTSGLLLSIMILLGQLGIYSKIPQLPDFMKNVGFDPMGGSLPSAIYLISLLPIAIELILRQKDMVKKVFFTVASAVLIFGLVIATINLLPGKSQSLQFPSLQTSWEIGVETLKKSPLLGVGAGNYLTAFNLYRPISFNQTGLWQVRFTTASNFYLTLVTEVGFLGIAAFAILLIGVYKSITENVKAKRWEIMSLALLLIVYAIFPISTPLMFPLFVLLAIFSGSENKVVTLGTGKVPSVMVAVPVLAGIAAVMFFGVKAVSGEVIYKKSLNALAKGDAKTTYSLMSEAISRNPKIDRYHASLAQVDMALATSLAAKKDITDNEKNTVTQLVQQAINEGKATVTLNPDRSNNWEVLAQIYRGIMPYASGADQFAIQTYSQAVSLDPTNPNVRIALGGVYYALGRYDEAIDAFKLAVLAKPDLANSHYNLAIAYREKKDFDRAILEMNNVLNLVAKDSSDYTLAKTTLEALEASRAALPKEKQGETLTSPEPISKSTITPPITLPEGSDPPTQ